MSKWAEEKAREVFNALFEGHGGNIYINDCAEDIIAAALREAEARGKTAGMKEEEIAKLIEIAEAAEWLSVATGEESTKAYESLLQALADWRSTP